MTGEGRAPIFGDDDLDISAFKPKQRPTETIAPEQVRAVAGPAFRSREVLPSQLPAPIPARREVRRYRTGRNAQLNLKVRPEAMEEFYALADQQGVVLGELFDMALVALKEKLATR